MDAQTYIKHFTNSSSLWRQMEQTVEDSPWHREASVAVHTQMCLDHYLASFASQRTEQQNKIALLSLLFHDVGKPDAEETIDRKDGSGTYRRYTGHELLSAIAFTECWLEDPHLREFVSADEARQIRFIIEHHLPYGYKDSKKRSDLRTAIEHTLREDVQTFYDCLRSDAAGRISDDHETKLQNVENWIDEFRTVPLTINKYRADTGKCYILIGPSGSGKSTWVNQHKGEHDYVVSLDNYRLQFYGHRHPKDSKTEYAEAWEYCNRHEEEFKKFVDAEVYRIFKGSLKSLKAQPFRNVFIDNTHGSKKSRARWIQEAREIGMKVVAVEFWNTLDTLIARQKTRPDKEVPASSLKQQYFAQTCAWKGSEVDEVILATEKQV
jgi:predicted kinase